MKMKEKFYRFMQGRYGMDGLSVFLVGAAFSLSVIDAVIRTRILNLFAYSSGQYQPIDGEGCSILGKVVAVIRRY